MPEDSFIGMCPECNEELSGTDDYKYCCNVKCMWDSSPPLTEEQVAFVEDFFSNLFVISDEPNQEEV